VVGPCKIQGEEKMKLIIIITLCLVLIPVLGICGSRYTTTPKYSNSDVGTYSNPYTVRDDHNRKIGEFYRKYPRATDPYLKGFYTYKDKNGHKKDIRVREYRRY